MYIKKSQFELCHSKAREISEQYALQHITGGDPRRYVDLLLDTVSTYLGKSIEKRRLDIHKDTTTVWAACINKPDGFDIVYVSGLNFCWERFVVCKEVFHIVLDDPEYWNMDLAGHVEEVTVAFPVLESKPGPSVVSELMAELAAMEFLFPLKARKAELEGDHKDDSLAIAEKYKVPQIHVERYLSSPYMDLLGKYG